MQRRFEQFTRSIARIYRCVQQIKHTEMRGLGLEGGHVMCLFCLGQHPEGLTAAELCALCGEDKAAVSRALAALRSRGLVHPDPEGARRRYRAKLFLTDRGRETSRQVEQLICQAVERGGAGLTPEQRETFYFALSRIADNLQKICLEASTDLWTP